MLLAFSEIMCLGWIYFDFYPDLSEVYVWTLITSYRNQRNFNLKWSFTIQALYVDLFSSAWLHHY
ncbi:hypothetical protein LX36DRAFT_397647 [Colletotrichum falcatum]|nr:hypothetical protein LX36DRAFT_397647 [Colletotrichum falcatum]